jgi:PAS domain S-box-containing protein
VNPNPAIPERFEMPEALRMSERQFRTLFENLPIGVGVASMAGNLLVFNDAMLQPGGYTREDIQKIGNVAELYYDPLQRAEALALFCQQGVLQAHPVQLKRKDGSPYDALLSLTPTTFHGQPAIQAMVEDVTARKRAQKALRLSENRLLEILNSLDGLVYVADMNTYETLFINRYGKEVWGDFTGKVCWQNLQSGQTGPCSFCTNSRLLHPDGTRAGVYLWEFQNTVTQQWYECRDTAISWPDGRTVRMEIAIDITARKRAEAEKSKLEALNRHLQKSESLGRMAGAVAHHFNNQLHAAMLNLEMVASDLPGNAKLVRALNEARQSVHKAAEVSTRLLTYLGLSETKPLPLDLAVLCSQSLVLLRAAMPPSVGLETDLPSPGPTIKADAVQIQQILTNLFTNAWEACQDAPGVVRLSVKTVAAAEIRAASRHPVGGRFDDIAHACLEVADTGSGIAAQDVEKVFDPYFTSKHTGRGMGLAVVLGIVRAHHAFVTVESEPNRGSVFRVYFPVSAEPVPLPPIPPPPAPGPEASGTVLVVEDEPLVRKAITLVLSQVGFKVLAAPDGVQAVELFQQRQDDITCVVCDLTMPGMNGWETMAALRKLAPDIPVILSSGYSDVHARGAAYREQPQAFLHKPHERDALLIAINQALGRRKG